MSEHSTAHRTAKPPFWSGVFGGAWSGLINGAIMVGIVALVAIVVPGTWGMVLATGLFGGVMAAKHLLFEAPEKRLSTQDFGVAQEVIVAKSLEQAKAHHVNVSPSTPAVMVPATGFASTSAPDYSAPAAEAGSTVYADAKTGDAARSWADRPNIAQSGNMIQDILKNNTMSDTTRAAEILAAREAAQSSTKVTGI